MSLGCVLLMLAGTAAPALATAPAGGPAGLDRFLSASLGSTRLPGMAVVVTHGSDVVYLKGFGADGHGGAVTPDTQFRVASLSKSFTALAVLQLVEARRLALDAPVRAYLPDFATADPVASGRITVRRLLNQTSGMADQGFPAITGAQPAGLRERVASLRGARLVSEPGREFHYFDPNYQVLARIVEVVSGEPFGSYLRDRVFVPLDMTGTVAAPTAAAAVAAAPRLAQGHVVVFGVPVARSELDGLLAGSGGVVSTAHDMGRWLVMQSTGRAPDGRLLLSPAGIELMHTPPPGVAGGYGQGWQVVAPQQGPRRIEHNGVLSTFSADQVLLPGSGYAFALLYDGNSALADTAGVKAGLAALLADGAAPGGVRSTWLVASVFACLTLLVLVLRLRLLLRLPRWASRQAGRPWWTAVPGLVWLLLPVVLLVAVPALVLALAGRSFTFWQLCLAMPDVMILVAVAAASGTVVAAGRVGLMIRDGQRQVCS